MKDSLKKKETQVKWKESLIFFFHSTKKENWCMNSQYPQTWMPKGPRWLGGETITLQMGLH